MTNTPGVSADRRIRVLFMQSQEFFGADSRIHATLMEHLDRRAFEVFAACSTGPSFAAISQIPGITVRPTRFGPTRTGRTKRQLVISALRTGPGFVADAIRLVRYCRARRIDIVHCTEKPRDALYGYLLSRVIGARCVIHVHVKAEDWISSMTQWAMRRADRLLAISEFVAGSLRWMGFDRISTVLNGLDLTNWNPERVDGQPLRDEFGVERASPLLVIVARLFAWKGHRLLIEAMPAVCAVHPTVRLLIVGEDDPRANPGGGSLTEELQELVARLGLGEHVAFTGFRSDVPEVMAACDVYAMPSFEEPFGMVFVEAMALRKPVVALDNGGTPEVVLDGITGLLSRPGDAEQLAENLVRLLDDPELRRALGAAGRARAVDRLGPGPMADGVAMVYRELVD